MSKRRIVAAELYFDDPALAAEPATTPETADNLQKTAKNYQKMPEIDPKKDSDFSVELEPDNNEAELKKELSQSFAGLAVRLAKNLPEQNKEGLLCLDNLSPAVELLIALQNESIGLSDLKDEDLAILVSAGLVNQDGGSLVPLLGKRRECLIAIEFLKELCQDRDDGGVLIDWLKYGRSDNGDSAAGIFRQDLLAFADPEQAADHQLKLTLPSGVTLTHAELMQALMKELVDGKYELLAADQIQESDVESDGPAELAQIELRRNIAAVLDSAAEKGFSVSRQQFDAEGSSLYQINYQGAALGPKFYLYGTAEEQASQLTEILQQDILLQSFVRAAAEQQLTVRRSDVESYLICYAGYQIGPAVPATDKALDDLLGLAQLLDIYQQKPPAVIECLMEGASTNPVDFRHFSPQARTGGMDPAAVMHLAASYGLKVKLISASEVYDHTLVSFQVYRQEADSFGICQEAAVGDPLSLRTDKEDYAAYRDIRLAELVYAALERFYPDAVDRRGGDNWRISRINDYQFKIIHDQKEIGPAFSPAGDVRQQRQSMEEILYHKDLLDNLRQAAENFGLSVEALAYDKFAISFRGERLGPTIEIDAAPLDQLKHLLPMLEFYMCYPPIEIESFVERVKSCPIDYRNVDSATIDDINANVLMHKALQLGVSLKLTNIGGEDGQEIVTYQLYQDRIDQDGQRAAEPIGAPLIVFSGNANYFAERDQLLAEAVFHCLKQRLADEGEKLDDREAA